MINSYEEELETELAEKVTNHLSVLGKHYATVWVKKEQITIKAHLDLNKIEKEGEEAGIHINVNLLTGEIVGFSRSERYKENWQLLKKMIKEEAEILKMKRLFK